LLAVFVHFFGPMAERLWAVPWQTVSMEVKSPTALRIGILGAATIAPLAIVWPASQKVDVVVTAVAARDLLRAEDFARRHGIPKVHTSYEALLSDPDIDAVYVPTPNGLHRDWSVKAMKAGKHVLCEKPFAANKEDAAEMLKVSKETDKVLMEAFHYRFHPLAKEMEKVVLSGKLGKIVRIDVAGELPSLFVPDHDIRYNIGGRDPKLAGGALMDIGPYAVNCFRLLARAAGVQNFEVVNVTAKEKFPKVESWLKAEMTAGHIPGSITASMEMSLLGIFKARAVVQGELGTMTVENFIVPFVYHTLTVNMKDGSSESVQQHYDEEHRTTYHLQLDAFAEAVQRKQQRKQPIFDSAGGTPEDAIENMDVIDKIYTKLGWGPRVGY